MNQIAVKHLIESLDNDLYFSIFETTSWSVRPHTMQSTRNRLFPPVPTYSASQDSLGNWECLKSWQEQTTDRWRTQYTLDRLRNWLVFEVNPWSCTKSRVCFGQVHTNMGADEEGRSRLEPLYGVSSSYNNSILNVVMRFNKVPFSSPTE
jgi:hypothetical protein